MKADHCEVFSYKDLAFVSVTDEIILCLGCKDIIYIEKSQQYEIYSQTYIESYYIRPLKGDKSQLRISFVKSLVFFKLV